MKIVKQFMTSSKIPSSNKFGSDNPFYKSESLVAGNYGPAVISSNIPNSTKPLIIDNFEGKKVVPSEKWECMDGIKVKIVSNDNRKGSSLRLTGSQQKYYRGFVSRYVGDSKIRYGDYIYISLDVRNMGTSGDILRVSLYDNDNKDWDVHDETTDDRWTLDLPLLEVGKWYELKIPFILFKDHNPKIGNDKMDLNPSNNKPGLAIIGFGLLSKSRKSLPVIDIDSVSFVNKANFPDRDGDGMEDGWEESQGLNPSNPYDAAVDRYGDGFINFIMFQNRK